MSAEHSTEEWRPVPSLRNISASSRGRFRHSINLTLIKTRVSSSGYLMVSIGYGDVSYYAHCLVAEAFIGSRPKGMDVDHINRVKSDNRCSNLRYVSRSQNTRNSSRIGCTRVIPAADVPSIVSRVDKGEKQIDIAKQYGVRHSTVSKAIKRFRLGVPLRER